MFHLAFILSHNFRIICCLFIAIFWTHVKKESKDDKEVLGEDMSLNVGVQRAEEPTKDLIIKETNKKVALIIPPTATTEMNSTLVNTYFVCSLY